jgi:hypothetical protein
MLPSPNPAAEPAFPSGSPRAALAAPAPIERLPAAVTAFVGRALKGPLNTPTPIGSFADYQQQFGGLWQPATLGYAIEQFFENGGWQAIVVRVANGARAPTLRLPSGKGELLLQGRHPGTREYLRASVDFDGIPAGDVDEFNVVVQRLRVPDSELIEEQEIVRRVSVRPDAERSVERVLARSKLVYVAGALPTERPDRTLSRHPGVLIGYVAANTDGADGTDLTDYDLIGDESARTGLFALRNGPRFEFLCVPPPSRNQDLGMATLLVAARLCRWRGTASRPRPQASASGPFGAKTRSCTFPGSARVTGCAAAANCSPAAGPRLGSSPAAMTAVRRGRRRRGRHRSCARRSGCNFRSTRSSVRT